MSFILDALKKSENARQRQAGPALFEVKVAPPRRMVPLWAIVIVILLVIINGVALSWMLLRRHAGPPATLTRTSAPAAVHDVVAPSVGTAAVSTPSPVPAASAPASARPAPVPAPGGAVQAPALAAAPMAAATGTAIATPPSASEAPAISAPQASSQASAAPTSGNFTPALQPPSTAGQPAGGLPLYAQIAAAPGSRLPQLHLDLHVYARNPSKRFVMLNMQKLRQGDSLADGVTVVRIRPDGVVLSYQGRRFLLPR